MNDQQETCLNPRCPHPVSMHSGRGCEAAIRADNITYGRCACREVGPRGGVSVRERAEQFLALADNGQEIGQDPYSPWEGVWAARALLEALNRIEAANGLHVKRTDERPGDFCAECLETWPCPTWLALNPKEADDA